MKNKIILKMMVVMCLVYAGCEKEEVHLNSKTDAQSIESKTVKKKKGDIIVLSSNINNPYDAVGQSHNQRLDEWIAGILDIVEDVPDSINYFYLSADEYMNNISVEDSLANAVIDSIQGDLVNITYGTPISTTLSTVLETQAAIDYISNLENIMNPTYSNNRNIEDHTDLIIDLEEDVINDEVISTEEKAIILMATSVSRHSSSYWYEVENNTTPWGGIPGSGGVGSADLSWGDVGIADLETFAHTLIGGMAAGTVTIIATGGLAAGPVIVTVGCATAWGSARNAGSQLGWW